MHRVFHVLLSLELAMLFFSVDCLRFMFTTNWPHFVCHITSVEVPSLFTYCNWTSVSGWYVVWFSFKV